MEQGKPRGTMRKSLLVAGALTLHLAAAAASDLPEPVRLCAEWEPARGTLIRWPLGIPWELVSGLAADDSLYVLVDNAYQQSQAEAAFDDQGVNLDNCRFFQIETYSHWTRDWGPHSVFVGADGEWGIIDPVFDGYPWVPGGPYESYMSSRGYEVDDAVNAQLAADMDSPLHEYPAYLTGGNFMTDGHGIGYSTAAMITENAPLWSQEELEGLAESWLGVSDYRFLPNPEEYGIQHIDCCAKLLDEETILLKEVPPWHPDHSRLLAIEDVLSTAVSCYGDPYEIVKVDCQPYSGDEVAAYTNSYMLNGKVFVPMFGIPADSAALSTYGNAMPGYEVVGVPYDGQWYYYDALHCRTREIMDPGMLLVRHDPLEGEVPWQESHPVVAEVIDYSGAGLVADQTGLHWRADGGPWEFVEAEPLPGPDSLAADIPAQPQGTSVEYYLEASDWSGRTERLPRTAPAGLFGFQVAAPSATAQAASPIVTGLTVTPNPTRGELTVGLTLPARRQLGAELYDLTGRLLGSMEVAAIGSGELQLGLRGLGARASGVYLLVVEVEGHRRAARVILTE